MERKMKKNTGILMVRDPIVVVIFITAMSMINCGNSVESPEYRVLQRLESDTEVRLYKESLWITSKLKSSTSFEKTTKDGFHRVYQYIHGGNLNSSQIVMSAPVLTTFVPATPAADSYVKFYLPAKYEAVPPLPNPELSLTFERWKPQCFAIRKFSGFVKDESISEEIRDLVTTLNGYLSVSGKAQILDAKAYLFTIAQYNASFHLSGRLNEVWFNVSTYSFEGCPSASF